MSLYDLVIVGGGPAGLTAGIYGARARLKTVILEKGTPGGQAYTTRELVNYPGFYRGTSGPELMKKMSDHAREFGAEILKDEVIDLDLEGEIKVFSTRKGSQYRAKAVILAPGSEPRLLNIKGEKELKGLGVSYCATCDAEFYDDLNVVVVGNGDAAIEEAVYITRFARKVTIIVIHDQGIVDCNMVSADRAFANPKIEFIWNSVLTEIKGREEVEAVVVKNLKTGELTEIEASGLFIYVGTMPRTDFLKGKVVLDERGYISTNDMMETSVEGVYAVGDARVKYLRQVVTAAGDGAVAAVAAERLIAEEEAFKEQVVNTDRPIVLAFWSPAEGKSIEAVSMLERVVSGAGGQVKLVKVDTSRKMMIARRYSISRVPAALLLESGRVTADLTGCLNERELLHRQLNIAMHDRPLQEIRALRRFNGHV